MKSKTNQKGSITVFVLISCLFFIIFLTGMFMLGAVKRQIQLEATKQTQDIYSQGNANEIYSNYFDEGVVVPIYTSAQFKKMCSGEQITINEEGGKIYAFSENSIYLLKEDITFEYEGIWLMPEFGETGRIEGNGKTITIINTNDEDKSHCYVDLNEYESPFLLNWDKSKLRTSKVEESTITGIKDTRIVPVPKGFVASKISGENTIEGGLVIYQGTEDVTGVKNNTEHITAMETRNQYVWIPVDDINSMVMCKSNSRDSVCNLVLQTDGTLKCETHNSDDLCGRLYEEIWNDTTYREPDIVSFYDKDDTEEVEYMKTAGITTGKVQDFKEQLTNDFNEMAISIAQYGGFYVSRYEAGDNGASKKNQTVITTGIANGTVFKGVNMWYGLYNAVHNDIIINDVKIMKSHMIYLSQYDQIIYFIGQEAETVHIERQLTEQGLTGANEADVMKNIFDLEANNTETMATASGDSYRAYAGGDFGYARDNKHVPASFGTRGYPISTYYNYRATRSVLYF